MTSQVPPSDADEIEQFWELARNRLRTNPVPGYFPPSSLDALAPPAWAFGATVDHADELLRLVLDGTKTATASALWDYEVDDEPVPGVGDLSIILDGRGHPRALLEIIDVRIVPFGDVDADHAFAEGEGDRSLSHWRDVHRHFFTTFAAHDRGFDEQMPVVTERFVLRFP
ncbi:MAG TPA: ASCH domain-containing protein [Aeromicrobium sp.]|nr:ASCH domain-containing protein [Aeromicrobium sp.]